MKPWIGVDLDGTLAHYDGWKNADHIGEPLVPMLQRVIAWLAMGQEVRIFTARVFSPPDDPKRQLEATQALGAIQQWCLKHVGTVLPVTCVKDYAMVELWDDRAIRVMKNTGEPCRCCGTGSV